MSEFKREERYAVIKLKDMIKAPLAIQENFKRARRYLQDEMLRGGAPVRAFVVVESDWPEYDLVWRLIEDRVSGRLGLTVSYEHAGRMIAESRCTALQQQLNDRDQKLDEAATEAGKLRANIDALAAQRDEGLAREADLKKELAQFQDGYTEQWQLREVLQQRLAEAKDLLEKAEEWFEDAGEWDAVNAIRAWLASPGCAGGEKAPVPALNLPRRKVKTEYSTAEEDAQVDSWNAALDAVQELSR